MPVRENFERQKDGETPLYWTFNRGTGTWQNAEIDTNFPHAGTKAMRLKAGVTGGSWAMFDYPILNREPVSFWHHVLTYADSQYFGSFAEPNILKPVAFIYINSSRQIFYRSGSSWIDSGILADTLSYRQLVFTHDYHRKTWSCWYNNVQVCAGIPFYNDTEQIASVGMGAVNSSEMWIDDVEIGSIPAPTEDAQYLVQVGPYVHASNSSEVVMDYYIDFRDNQPTEAWIDLEVELVKAVEPGELMTIEIVPYGGTTLEQFFYGVVQDILPSGPNRIRILAKDALDNVQNVNVDTLYYGNIRENYELTINAGFLLTDGAYVQLPDAYATIVKPILRAQVITVPDWLYRPTADYRSGKTPINWQITNANSYKAIATPFIAEHTRWQFCLFEGSSNTNYDWLLCADDNGQPGTVLAQQLNISPISGYHGPQYFTNEPIRLSIGRKYWIVIRPNNTGVPYTYTFYSYDNTPPNVGTTNQGIYRQTNAGTWVGSAADEIGSILIQYLVWNDVEEGVDFRHDSGTNRLVFDLGLRPEYVSNGAIWQNGCRVFYLYSTIDLANVLADILNDVAEVDYFIQTGTLVPYVLAADVKALDLITELCEAEGWQIRQIHRSEGAGYQNNPPTVRAGSLPVFGSPVVTLRYGQDSSIPATEARVINDALRKEFSALWTGVRLTAKDPDGNTLFHQRTNPAIEIQMDALSGPVLAAGGLFHRLKNVRAGNAQNTAELDEIAQAILAISSVLTWTGNLEVEGATWIRPGQTVAYENSRRGIVLTEFRVQGISYSPKRMTLTLSSQKATLEAMFRSLNAQLEAYGSLQGLETSILSRVWQEYGTLDDTILSTSAAMKARLRASVGGSYTSATWRQCQVVAGPTVNGYPSRLVYCFFPAEDGLEGHGVAGAVRFRDDATTHEADMTLDVFGFHWADNGVAICGLLYRT